MAQVRVTVTLIKDGQETIAEDESRDGGAIYLPVDLLQLFGRYSMRAKQEGAMLTIKIASGLRSIWIFAPSSDRTMPELERLAALLREVQRASDSSA